MTDPHPDSIGEQCGAKKRDGKGTCKRAAGAGTDHLGAGHCKLHGGSTRNGVLHGASILARRDLQAWARPLPIDPHDALIEAVSIAWGMVAYATDRVNELLEHELVGPTLTVTRERSEPGLELDTHMEGEDLVVDDVKPTDGTTTKIVAGAPAPNVWIRLRDEALERAVRFSKVCLDANIDERQVKLAEAKGQLLAGALRNILTRLGVADHPDAPAVVRAELTRIVRRPDDIAA